VRTIVPAEFYAITLIKEPTRELGGIKLTPFEPAKNKNIVAIKDKDARTEAPNQREKERKREIAGGGNPNTKMHEREIDHLFVEE